MNENEYASVVKELKSLEGSRLQLVCLREDHFDLGFWTSQGLQVIRSSFSHRNYFFLPLRKGTFNKKKSLKKPLVNFLNAHAMGTRLLSLAHLSDFGRVVQLRFAEDKVAEGKDINEKMAGSQPSLKSSEQKEISIELRLFQQGKNIIARVGSKQVSLFPVKDLEPSKNAKEVFERRSLDRLQEIYLSENSTPSTPSTSSASNKDYEARYKKKMVSLRNTLEKVTDQREKNQDRSNLWKKAGEELLQAQKLSVSESLKSFIDLKKTFSVNLENCFSQSKKLKAKDGGYASRISDLKNELEELAEVKDYESWGRSLEDKKGREKKQTSSRGQQGVSKKNSLRSFQIESDHWVRVGRSAQQNLLLLRSSKPWDFWMHLRDHPGAHGVIECQRKEVLGLNQLKEAAQFLLKIHFGSKFKNHAGEIFDVLGASCRYVKPIKGDKLGRVNYSNEQSFSVKFQP